MVFDLKWLKFLPGGRGQASRPGAGAALIEEPRTPGNSGRGQGGQEVPGPLSVIKQLQILGGILLLLMLVIAAVIYHDNRESTYGSVYIATAGEMRMLSQRLAKASSLAQQGNASAFKQLHDSHEQFVRNLERLTRGGELAGTLVPPSPDNVRPQLEKLTAIWSISDQDAIRLLDMETNLVSLSKDVMSVTETNSQLLELTEQVASLRLQSGSGAREIAAANQMVMLTQRIAKNASSLLVGDEISPEIAFLLGKDSNTFRDLLNAQLKGSEQLRIAMTTDAETRRKLGELEGYFREYQYSVNRILGSMQQLIIAKRAGSEIFHGSEELLDATGKLARAYQQGITDRAAYGATLGALVLLALAVLGAMAKVYLVDTRRQAQAAEQSRQLSEQVNRQNQDAILRLMNELGDLADGDLTVTATVSEDITGAIADSINYTIEELRVLVGRINNAASRVAIASGIAQQTSAELLDASKRQSLEIQAAGHSVLLMARSMTQVSGSANQSAQVARQSLAAAVKGTQAVQDSIKGMNDIRGQIQETSKRIKRLGESSQEIGEIVELISDITEQTNVLALNAAIQAASAGEAGRGFTVVAEEVQRLAERSGEATKQIAAIVKTIQTDTQGAVSAMEESTRGVVDGAKRSDAAGQALAEIGEVSQNLAELIENISDATRRQADSATGVAGKMQDILRVTEQATAGTQRTASAVGELAGLATELKSSVAGFKVG
jgi:twitching motility protein PilJ